MKQGLNSLLQFTSKSKETIFASDAKDSSDSNSPLNPALSPSLHHYHFFLRSSVEWKRLSCTLAITVVCVVESDFQKRTPMNTAGPDSPHFV